MATWLRGVSDGQVKLFAAMLHEEKVIIAQHRIPDETTETTQVKELLEPVDLKDAVVTADAAHAQRETAEYIAGPEEDGGRGSDYFLFVKGNQPRLQQAIFSKVQDAGKKAPDHVELDYGYGRIIKRSLWVTDAGDLDFPQVTRVVRIRRDRCDITGALISKEIVHAVTSLDAGQACSTTPASRKLPPPSNPSPATGPACSATYRYETGIRIDFADPVGAHGSHAPRLLSHVAMPHPSETVSRPRSSEFSHGIIGGLAPATCLATGQLVDLG